MFVLVENDSITKTVPSNRGITIGENQYPRAIYTSAWSVAEREAIGIYEVVHDNTNFKDQQYYNNTNQSFAFADGVVTASYGSATANLKTQKKSIIKSQASGLLTPTDWHVIKATEVESYSVPAEMTTYRAAVRTASNDMETLIDACTTVDELAALYVHTDGTRPLGEWPEEV